MPADGRDADADAVESLLQGTAAFGDLLGVAVAMAMQQGQGVGHAHWGRFCVGCSWSAAGVLQASGLTELAFC